MTSINNDLHEQATNLGLNPQPWWDDKFTEWAILQKEMTKEQEDETDRLLADR